MATGDANTKLSNRVLGRVFACLAVTLIVMMAYLIIRIVQPLTSETAIATYVIRAYAQEIEQHSSARTIDEDTVRFLIGLEYSAAAIRTVSVQIAFASVAGFFLIVVGILLFASGAIRPMTAEVAAGLQQSLKLADAAPGTVIAVLGAIILGLGVMKQMPRGEITFSRKLPGTATSNEPSGFNAKSSISQDPIPADPRYHKGNNSQSDPDEL